MEQTRVDTTPLVDNFDVFEDMSMLFENNNAESVRIEEREEEVNMKFDDDPDVVENRVLEKMDFQKK